MIYEPRTPLFGTPHPARHAAETAAFFDVLHGNASLEDEATLERLHPGDVHTLRQLATVPVTASDPERVAAELAAWRASDVPPPPRTTEDPEPICLDSRLIAFLNQEVKKLFGGW